MFHEHNHQRGAEFNELSAELKALELRLTRQPLAAPRIDRDRLMFTAGEAAATYRAQPSCPGPSWAHSRFWPAATAAMTAATIALAITLAWPPGESQVAKPQVVVNRDKPAPTTSMSGVAESDAPNFTADRKLREMWPLSDGLTSRYLTARGMVLPRDINSFARDDRIAHSNSETFDDPPREPATARSLLEELLPDSSRRPERNS